METDEQIGPEVVTFENAEKELQVLGQELTRVRDASSAMHEARMHLSQLHSGASCIASMRTFGERQQSIAQLSATLAANYDRFVTISVNQLEGLAGVVSNKYKSYCNKVMEMRRRKAQLQVGSTACRRRCPPRRALLAHPVSSGACHAQHALAAPTNCTCHQQT